MEKITEADVTLLGMVVIVVLFIIVYAIDRMVNRSEMDERINKRHERKGFYKNVQK